MDVWAEPNKFRSHCDVLVSPTFFETFLQLLHAKGFKQVALVKKDIQKCELTLNSCKKELLPITSNYLLKKRLQALGIFRDVDRELNEFRRRRKRETDDVDVEQYNSYAEVEISFSNLHQLFRLNIIGRDTVKF
jgi:hypothetical protein